MALAPNTAFGLLNPGTTNQSTPLTYVDVGATPDAITGPNQPDQISGGPLGPPPSGPSLPHIPGATVTVTGGGGNPYGAPPPPAPSRPGTSVAPVAPPPQQQQPFDLSGLVNSFPGVANALALEQQGLGQLDANLNAARQRAIINFGDPALAQMAGFGLDPQAGAFAQQNYLSGNATLARLDKAHQLAAQQVVNNLAAHGILNSGDLGYLEGRENQAYGNNVYDAQQQVLSQLADLYNNYLNSRYGLEQNANSAQMDALNQFLANPDAFSSLFGQQPQRTTAAASSTLPAAKVAKRALTNYTGVKGPAIGAFK